MPTNRKTKFLVYSYNKIILSSKKGAHYRHAQQSGGIGESILLSARSHPQKNMFCDSIYDLSEQAKVA